MHFQIKAISFLEIPQQNKKHIKISEYFPLEAIKEQISSASFIINATSIYFQF